MRMNTNYNMLTDGQKAFLADYVDKLQSAVDRIAELKGETPDLDNPPDVPPEEQPDTSNLGLIIGLSAAGVVIVVAAVVIVLLLLRRRKGNAPEAAAQPEQAELSEASEENQPTSDDADTASETAEESTQESAPASDAAEEKGEEE